MEAELKDLCTQEVTISQTSTIDEYGKRTYSAGVPYRCHLQVKSQEVNGRGGVVVTAIATAWLDGYYPEVDSADGATVPVLGAVPIVAVSHDFTEDGPYATNVYFGAS